MVFQKITKDNIKKLYPHLYSCNYGLCDYTPMVLLLWGDYYHYAYAEQGGSLFLSMQKDDETFFLLPITQNLESALATLSSYCTKTPIAMPSDRTPAWFSLFATSLNRRESFDVCALDIHKFFTEKRKITLAFFILLC